MRISMIIAAAASAAVALAACTQPADEVAADVEAYGLSDVHVIGYAGYSCGKDDNFATEFVAVDANGRHVRGVDCSGGFKESTIRGLRMVR